MVTAKAVVLVVQEPLAGLEAVMVAVEGWAESEATAVQTTAAVSAKATPV
jgi:hypothetical protein